MIRMVNALTGGAMYVHEDRVEAYLAAGHKLPPPPEPRWPEPGRPEWSPSDVKPLEELQTAKTTRKKNKK